MLKTRTNVEMATAIQSSVGIVVLNWRGLDDTRACCESLAKISYPDARIFVVDNASGDGSAEALQSEFPQFIHVSNAKNLGFSGGNNAAMNRVLAENHKYVLLLNNDTIAAPDFLEAMVNAAETDPQIGMVGAKIYYFDSPDVLWYAGGTVDFEKPEPFGHVGENDRDRGQYDEPGETGWVTGCCLLARGEALKQVGLLDEAFGYYCEDVDWCLRANKAGWKIWYEPRAKVWHKIGRSTGRGSLPIQYYNCRNILLIARKNLAGVEKIKFFARVIKWIRHYPRQIEYKPAVVEAAVHGILGCGGSVQNAGKAWWSRTVVFLQSKYQILKEHLFSERLV